jgi:hypothetical protein
VPGASAVALDAAIDAVRATGGQGTEAVIGALGAVAASYGGSGDGEWARRVKERAAILRLHAARLAFDRTRTETASARVDACALALIVPGASAAALDAAIAAVRVMGGQGTEAVIGALRGVAASYGGSGDVEWARRAEERAAVLGLHFARLAFDRTRTATASARVDACALALVAPGASGAALDAAIDAVRATGGQGIEAVIGALRGVEASYGGSGDGESARRVKERAAVLGLHVAREKEVNAAIDALSAAADVQETMKALKFVSGNIAAGDVRNYTRLADALSIFYTNTKRNVGGGSRTKEEQRRVSKAIRFIGNCKKAAATRLRGLNGNKGSYYLNGTVLHSLRHGARGEGTQ